VLESQSDMDFPIEQGLSPVTVVAWLIRKEVRAGSGPSEIP